MTNSNGPAVGSSMPRKIGNSICIALLQGESLCFGKESCIPRIWLGGAYTRVGCGEADLSVSAFATEREPIIRQKRSHAVFRRFDCPFQKKADAEVIYIPGTICIYLHASSYSSTGRKIVIFLRRMGVGVTWGSRRATGHGKFGALSTAPGLSPWWLVNCIGIWAQGVALFNIIILVVVPSSDKIHFFIFLFMVPGSLR